jgi:hypothetical protein
VKISYFPVNSPFKSIQEDYPHARVVVLTQKIAVPVVRIKVFPEILYLKNHKRRKAGIWSISISGRGRLYQTAQKIPQNNYHLYIN